MRLALKLVLMLSLLATAAFSQTNNFALPGTTWHYDYGGLGMAGVVRYQVMEDTVIDSRVCRKVSVYTQSSLWTDPGTLVSSYRKSKYLFEDNGLVYWWNEGLFDTLYNYNALVGDSWQIRYPDSAFGCYSGLVTVDSITMDLFGGDSLRVFYATVSGDNFLEPAKVVFAERLGGLLSLFPNPAPCAFDLDMVWNVRCFSDTGLSIQFSGVACELATAVAPVVVLNPELSLVNPAPRSLSGVCRNCPAGGYVVLVDGFGRTLLRERIKEQIDIALPNGFAGFGVVTVADANGSVVQRLKLVSQ